MLNDNNSAIAYLNDAQLSLFFREYSGGAEEAESAHNENYSISRRVHFAKSLRKLKTRLTSNPKQLFTFTKEFTMRMLNIS
jgi:hypothetical protein